MNTKQFSSTVAILSIWLAVAITSVFARDMITGSEQEHIPIAAIFNWFWGSIATASIFLAIVFRKGIQTASESRWVILAALTAGIWLVVIFTSIFAPYHVTGSDPTQTPVAVLMGPVIAAVATAFLSGFVALVGSRD